MTLKVVMSSISGDFTSKLTEEESRELIHSMVYHLIEVAKQKNKPRETDWNIIY